MNTYRVEDIHEDPMELLGTDCHLWKEKICFYEGERERERMKLSFLDIGEAVLKASMLGFARKKDFFKGGFVLMGRKRFL